MSIYQYKDIKLVMEYYICFIFYSYFKIYPEPDYEEAPPHWQLWNKACEETHKDYLKSGIHKDLAYYPLTYRI
jgi:hypothetical protein